MKIIFKASFNDQFVFSLFLKNCKSKIIKNSKHRCSICSLLMKAMKMFYKQMLTFLNKHPQKYTNLYGKRAD